MNYAHSHVENHIGFLTLDRPTALNALSLDMVRHLTESLLHWHDDADVRAIVIRSTSDKAFCAGGDIRFFHDAGSASPRHGSALLEDFFTEEYALNHQIHHYPKPCVALMDGVVMGGGMGLAQGRIGNCLRIVTERTRMAMPEVNIGFFPDVGGSHFLSRAPGQIGTYLGLTGEAVRAADALYAGLADVFLPSEKLPALSSLLTSTDAPDLRAAVCDFAASFSAELAPDASLLATHRMAIDRHFSHDDLRMIVVSLKEDGSLFAQQTLEAMQKRSPLMMCVTLAQLRRGVHLNLAECLRMERTMVRRSFETGEVLEGIRAAVIDKDYAPAWIPSAIEEVTPAMVEHFFVPAWPAHAHPLRSLV